MSKCTTERTKWHHLILAMRDITQMGCITTHPLSQNYTPQVRTWIYALALDIANWQ